jgi:hypothetical protein
VCAHSDGRLQAGCCLHLMGWNGRGLWAGAAVAGQRQLQLEMQMCRPGHELAQAAVHRVTKGQPALIPFASSNMAHLN